MIHRRDVVLFIPFDCDHRFLLQHRDDSAPTFPSYWGFFGGGVELNETPLEALQREAYEELRYRPVSLTPWNIVDYKDEKNGRHGTKFYYSELCRDKSSLELHEGQAMGWFSAAEAKSLLCTPSNIQILKKCLATLH